MHIIITNNNAHITIKIPKWFISLVSVYNIFYNLNLL